jgi:hypothetical protein
MVTLDVTCAAKGPFTQSQKCESDVFHTSCWPELRDICIQYIIIHTGRITSSRGIMCVLLLKLENLPRTSLRTSYCTQSFVSSGTFSSWFPRFTLLHCVYYNWLQVCPLGMVEWWENLIVQKGIHFCWKVSQWYTVYIHRQFIDRPSTK